MTQEQKQRLTEIIQGSKNIVFFGGAGVSTESGIPDFRSKDGLYNNKDIQFEKYEPEYLLSHDCLEDNPEVFYEFYRQKLDTRSIEPNITHKVLAKMEEKGILKAVVTQNIDGLHQKAGSKTVYEIHGTIMRTYCADCDKEYPYDYIFNCGDKVPRCECGGVIRLDVTLYQEQLPSKVVSSARQAISQADCLIIGGTSLVVYPANTFVYDFCGKYIVVINRDKLQIKLGDDDLEINESLGEVFSFIEAII